jgi:LysM repeat protein
LPRGWFNWTIWQYSDKGKVNGINASVDMNIFNGTLEELYKFAGANIPVQTPKTHIVVKSDNFESIANAYGVTVRELVMANPQLLNVGDKLTVPVAIAIPQEDASTSAPVAVPGDSGTFATPKQTYTVKPNDSLSAIAVKYSTTIAAIASANDIKNINTIKVGQVLIIP